ncbi:MAG: D-2-hydroxyacid dehydrogenase [Termitinemataceae bacterium]
MKKICVLDGYALNPGDLSWKAFENLGLLTVYERTVPDQVLERARDFEILLTNKTLLTREVLESLPQVRYIGVLATGYNVVDIEYARHRGIVVTNVPGYSTDSVAQLTFALLLELCHHVQDHSTLVHHGEWSTSKDFCFWKYPLMELAGKTFGIIGVGSIGKRVAQLAHAFGMKVVGYSRRQRPVEQVPDFTYLSLEELFKVSDVVSLHCPLTQETKGIVNEHTLGLMKRSAVLINTSRGPLVDEHALATALKVGRIAGAAVDVLSQEPPPETNPLLQEPRCIITPHIAWATTEARSRLMAIAADNLRHYLAGAPVNVVS